MSAGRRDLGHPRLVAVRVRFVEHGQQPRVKSAEGGLEQHRADVPCGYGLDEGGEESREEVESVALATERRHRGCNRGQLGMGR